MRGYLSCVLHFRHPDGSETPAAEPPQAEAEAEGGEATGQEQAPPGGVQTALPIKERNSHAAVAVDRYLYIIGGDNQGDLLKEYAMCDTGDRAAAGWMEPILKGDIPSARKAAAVMACGNKIFMFGGMMPNSEEVVVPTDELVVLEITGPNDLTATVNPPTQGTCPVARGYAIFQEYSAGRLFLYGGMDVSGKPLNDGWILDVASMTWELVFNGHSDLVLPTGSIATLVGSRLVMLNSAAGSPKLDLAASIDFSSIRDSYLFTNKMRQDAVMMLESLEAWSEKQGHGMELARNLDKLSQSFDNLLKVMDALLQVMTVSHTWTPFYR
jgi:dynein heavy chain